jgi:hypothetical protein
MTLMPGVERGAGEPPEAAWSHIGPYGYILQYQSLPARQACLERIAAYWNAAKLLELPALLLRMFSRAAARADAAMLAIAELQAYAISNDIQPAQVVLLFPATTVVFCSGATAVPGFLLSEYGIY